MLSDSPSIPQPAPPRPGVLDRVFAFCASLKMAVLTMCTLAAVLAIGSVYEAVYGLDAVQVMVYRAPWFAWLLAILSLNIFAAAAIRFPWKRRQWAFLVTHLGLLVLLLGFAVGLRLELDGALALTPGQTTRDVRLKEERFTVELLDSTGSTVAGTDVPISLLDAGVYPPLWRFVLSPLWSLPDEPRWPEGRARRLELPSSIADIARARTGGTLRIDVIDWYPAAEAVPGGAPLAEGMREGATPYRPLPHSPRQAALAAAKLRVAFAPPGGAQTTAPRASRSESQATRVREFWIGRDGAPREVTVGGARLRITYGILHADMGFAITLTHFVRTTDTPGAGAMTPSGMESTVMFHDRARAIERDPGMGGTTMPVETTQTDPTMPAPSGGTGIQSVSTQTSGTGVPPVSTQPLSSRGTGVPQPSTTQPSGTGVPPVSTQPIPENGGGTHPPVRSAVITLNNPVRHGGLTFYQAGSDQRDDATTISILSVNRDPGRWIKYAGCVLVVLGVVGMFVRGNARNGRSISLKQGLKAQVASALGLFLALHAFGVRADANQITQVNQMFELARSEPVFHEGRIKPHHAALVESLVTITGSESPDGCENLSDLLDSMNITDVFVDPLQLFSGDPRRDRFHWLCLVLYSDRADVIKCVEGARIILVDSREVAALFDVPEGTRHVSLNDVSTSAAFGAALSGAKAMQERSARFGSSASLSAMHRALLRVEQRARTLRDLQHRTWFGICYGRPTDQFLDALGGGDGENSELPRLPRAEQLWDELIATLPSGADASVIRNRFAEQFTWLTEDEAYELASADGQFDLWWIRQPMATTEHALNTELWYVRSHPFRIAAWTFLVACLLLSPAGLGGRAVWTRWLWWVGIGAGAGAVAVAASGIYARIVITGRAPVTNMYESVVWAAAVCGASGLIADALLRRRFIALAACLFAAVASLAADAMPADLGRTISNLQPILRDNFWLTTHVLSVVSAYAALALAMVLGNFALVREMLHKVGSRVAFVRPPGRRRTQTTAPNPNGQEHGRDARATGTQHGRDARATDPDSGLHLAIYRCIQVGVVLMAAGTALGAVWADHAWGRFWAWDPKEVWALIVLLVYLAVLHGRLAGWLGAFGLAACSVLGFLAVIMAWYGVNFVLGAGLHTYGFGAGGGAAVSVFVAIQLAVVGAAWMVHKRRSSAARTA